jgi:type II secretory pathway component PulF
MYINMVRVVENLGSLDKVMERLAESLEKRNILKSKIQSALWYPAFMIFFSLCVVIFLLITVIPQIAMMFEQENKEIPLPTEIVIFMSKIMSVIWPFIPMFIILGLFIFRKFVERKEGRHKIDEIKLKIPLIKNLYNKIIVYRFTQNLGILLNNKVDIIKSFEIVQKIVSNVVIEEKISEASKMIREGSSVSNALRKVNFLPKLVLGMISAGESSDNLDSMLLNIGNVYETEIDLNVASLTSILEPLIIVFMGAVVGLIFISIMLPIMSMNVLVQ